MNFMQHICGICLKGEQKLRRMCVNGCNISYYSKLSLSVPEMVFKELEEHGMICAECCVKLDAAHKLREQCLRSKQLLTDYISKLNSTSEISSVPEFCLQDISDQVNNSEEDNEQFETNNYSSTDNTFINDFNSNNLPVNAEEVGIENSTGSNATCEPDLQKYNDDMVPCNTTENVIIKEEIDIKMEPEDIIEYDVTTEMNPSAQWETEKGDIPKEIYVKEKCFSCDQCGKAFTKSYNLVKHKRVHSVKSQEKPFECDQCGKTFNYNSEFVRHKRTHTGEKPHKCDQCEKSFTQNSHLLNHKRTHTGEKPHQCDECEKAYTVPSQLKIHKLTHTIEKPFKCKLCGEESPLLIKRSHSCKLQVKQPFECDQCEKKFAYNSDLVRHKRTHTGEKPHQCEECGKLFTQNSHLLHHKLTHAYEKSHKCDVCGKGFVSNIYLVRHKRTHTGEKPYTCDLCGKAYSASSLLIDHKRTHTGEPQKKPFKCVECGKTFTYNSQLVKHKRRHTGEMPYECDICGKGYFENNKLVIHKRTHTGEKPFECDLCGKAFMRISHLVRHKRIHTSDQLLNNCSE